MTTYSVWFRNDDGEDRRAVTEQDEDGRWIPVPFANRSDAETNAAEANQDREACGVTDVVYFVRED